MTGDEIGSKVRRKSAAADAVTPLPGLPGGEPAEGAATPPLATLDRAALPKSRAARKVDPVVAAIAPAAVLPVPMPEPASLQSNQEQVTDASPATRANPIPAVPATHADPMEGLNSMATVATPFPATATEATDKAQAMFGDMNGRFKTAFEKSSKMGEEMVELTKGNVEALVASAKIAAKAGETLGQEAADYGKKRIETTVAMFKSLAAVKSPTELFQIQSEFAKSAFDSAVAEASKFSESMMKVAGEVVQPLSNRYAVAAEKIKATAL